MNFMIEEAPNGLPPSALSEIFDRMIWTSDNGQLIMKVQDEWMSGSSAQKVINALSMNERLIDNKKLT